MRRCRIPLRSAASMPCWWRSATSLDQGSAAVAASTDEEATMSPRTIRLSADDNVVIAVDQIAQGAQAAAQIASERIPRGHKMAIALIAEGEPVRKYGQIIGFASRPIAPG